MHSLSFDRCTCLGNPNPVRGRTWPSPRKFPTCFPVGVCHCLPRGSHCWGIFLFFAFCYLLLRVVFIYFFILVAFGVQVVLGLMGEFIVGICGGDLYPMCSCFFYIPSSLPPFPFWVSRVHISLCMSLHLHSLALVLFFSSLFFFTIF